MFEKWSDQALKSFIVSVTKQIEVHRKAMRARAAEVYEARQELARREEQ